MAAELDGDLAAMYQSIPRGDFRILESYLRALRLGEADGEGEALCGSDGGATATWRSAAGTPPSSDGDHRP